MTSNMMGMRTSSDSSSRISSRHSASDSTSTSASAGKSAFQSKADPNVALWEAQPMAQFGTSTSTFSLRSIQHKDWKGNIITDPDRSNPTRSRMERPLETIMSFDAAIRNRYKEESMAAKRT